MRSNFLKEKKKILNKMKKKNCCIIRNVTNLRRGQRRAKTKMIKIIRHKKCIFLKKFISDVLFLFPRAEDLEFVVIVSS